ncbi:MAG TPA: ribose 5-phosphate isomerase B [Gemmatimonadaceae bacterium]|nr:ribose 5-phosphate isomerase B [Gemmatimonadaceae bacterium]
MKVAVGADHAGFPLKEKLVDTIREAGHQVIDCGAEQLIPGDDYPDYAERVANAIRDGQADRGVLVCGSGVGASVAANKFVGIRAALCHDTFSAHQGVEDDSMNVLCLGARVIGPSLAEELVIAFLRARFSNAERHARRLAKIIGFEKQPAQA